MSENLLEVHDLSLTYDLGRSGLVGRKTLQAVKGASLQVPAQSTVALVGESGSGKSSLAKAILRLLDPRSAHVDGEVQLLGRDVLSLRAKALRQLRSEVQMVFQDPYSSLDPSMRIMDIVEEPLKLHTRLTKPERLARVAEALGWVGLQSDHGERYPNEFSGGQRQRVAIARAIVLRPRFLLLDEPVSALDVSTRNQVLNLLLELKERLDLTYLIVSHDLSLVKHISDEIVVMCLGEVVETGPTQRVYRDPAHPYTAVLLSSVPLPDPRKARLRNRIVLRGEMPDPQSPPSACRFHTRCPAVMPRCREVDPPMYPIAGGGLAKCYLHDLGADEIRGSSVAEHLEAVQSQVAG